MTLTTRLKLSEAADHRQRDAQGRFCCDDSALVKRRRLIAEWLQAKQEAHERRISDAALTPDGESG